MLFACMLYIQILTSKPLKREGFDTRIIRTSTLANQRLLKYTRFRLIEIDWQAGLRARGCVSSPGYRYKQNIICQKARWQMPKGYSLIRGIFRLLVTNLV